MAARREPGIGGLPANEYDPPWGHMGMGSTRLDIQQKKNSNRIRFVFHEDALDYSIEDGSGSRAFSVDYAEIGRDRQTLVERNQWLRNVGLLWLALGAGLTAYSLTTPDGLRVSIWLVVGAACYAFYRLRSTRFTLVSSDKGNLCVIDDADGARILDEIATRRARYLRNEYDFMPEGETAEQHRKRFNWLHREGVLSDEELAERLERVGLLDVPADTAASVPAGIRLN